MVPTYDLWVGLIKGPVATVFHGKDMSAYLKKHPDAYTSLFLRGDLFLPISDLWRDKQSNDTFRSALYTSGAARLRWHPAQAHVELRSALAIFPATIRGR